jgi:hypothetical protein
MSDERVRVVKLIDEHGVEHKVKVRAESVYEAALLGLKRLERVGWESDGSTIGSVIVEVWEEPTNQPRSSCRKASELAEGARKISTGRTAESQAA